MNILDILKENSDEKYAIFQSKLTPSVDKNLFIGVRVPKVRKIAKEIKNTKEAEEFLNILPHKYYDENMLHGLLISEVKDYDKCILYLNKFLPYIDNWAVCDILSPKIFKKNKDKLLIDIKRWIKSKNTYEVRFAVEMLMSHFLDEDFKQEYLSLVETIQSDEYYINMMRAWYFATALTKQWDSTIYIINENKLDTWTHNKTVQKCIESYRISDQNKEYLRSLKR